MTCVRHAPGVSDSVRHTRSPLVTTRDEGLDRAATSWPPWSRVGHVEAPPDRPRRLGRPHQPFLSICTAPSGASCSETARGTRGSSYPLVRVDITAFLASAPRQPPACSWLVAHPGPSAARTYPRVSPWACAPSFTALSAAPSAFCATLPTFCMVSWAVSAALSINVSRAPPMS